VLGPEGRAVLSLLLVQDQSYSEIAELLRIDRERVRARAHVAVEALAPSSLERPSPPARRMIIDYLLGDQTLSERARTRVRLTRSPTEWAWAAALSEALEPLAAQSLPALPDPPEAVTESMDTTAAAPAYTNSHDQATVETRAVEATTPPQPARTVTPPRTAKTRAGPPARPPRPPRSRRSARRRLKLLIAGGGLVAAATAVTLILVLESGGGHRRARPSAAYRGPARSGPSRSLPEHVGQTQPRTVRRLVLAAAGPDHRAVGSGTVIRQGGGLLLLLRAHGLAPNRNNFYGVWLFNSPSDARLLGFVSPAVGAAGTFSSGTNLPSDAVRFRELIVTVEVSSHPVTPGPAVLRTTLGLS
jgi:Sigma-70, region 4